MTQREKIEEILRIFRQTILDFDPSKPLKSNVIELHEAATQIDRLITEARIEELDNLPQSEIGKLANHSLAVDIHVQDRIAELQASLKGEEDEVQN